MRDINKLQPNEIIEVKTKKEAKAIGNLLKNIGVKQVEPVLNSAREHCLLIVEENKTLSWDFINSALDYDKYIIVPASDFLPKKKKVTRKWVLKQIQKALEPKVHEKALKEILKQTTCPGTIPVTDPQVLSENPNELEVKKWYRHDAGGLVFVTKIENHLVYCYGFYNDDMWFDEASFIHSYTTHLSPATNEEVFEALKAEAIRLGFKEGVKIKSFVHSEGYNVFVIKELNTNVEYIDKYNKLHFGTDGNTRCAVVFDNGKWAEILPAEPEIDWNATGAVFECTEHPGLLVMLDSQDNENVFSGTCVQNTSDTYKNTKKGEYDQWAKSQFKPYNGTITLSNN